jgi:hypothetical protein
MIAKIHISVEELQPMRDAVESFGRNELKIISEEIVSCHEYGFSVRVEIQYNFPDELYHLGTLVPVFRASSRKESVA